jgi:hypothetical protein
MAVFGLPASGECGLSRPHGNQDLLLPKGPGLENQARAPILGGLLLVLTTDTRTPQGSIATGNTTHRQTTRAALRKLSNPTTYQP